MKRGLAASLIVRNEAHTLAPCLTSLTGLVDEIHVHDTGSTDGTPELAVKLGAIVTMACGGMTSLRLELVELVE